jgi:hypothetical protein
LYLALEAQDTSGIDGYNERKGNSTFSQPQLLSRIVQEKCQSNGAGI